MRAWPTRHRHRVLGGAQRPIPRLLRGGLPVVLSQTFRTLIYSQLELGLKGYEHSHPGTDILLFEPDHRDPEMFLAHTFGYAQRRSQAEPACRQTRAGLHSRRGQLAAKLAAHGLALNDSVLDDPRRRLLGRATRDTRATATRRTPAACTLQRLDDVLDDLERALAG